MVSIITVQADGKILVAGFSHNGSNDDFALVRYNSDGSLDTTFDGDGMVTTAIGPGYDYANSVTVQADGKVLVAGLPGLRAPKGPGASPSAPSVIASYGAVLAIPLPLPSRILSFPNRSRMREMISVVEHPSTKARLCVIPPAASTSSRPTISPTPQSPPLTSRSGSSAAIRDRGVGSSKIVT